MFDKKIDTIVSRITKVVNDNLVIGLTELHRVVVCDPEHDFWLALDRAIVQKTITKHAKGERLEFRAVKTDAPTPQAPKAPQAPPTIQKALENKETLSFDAPTPPSKYLKATAQPVAKAQAYDLQF